MPRPPRTAEQREKRNRRDRERQEKQKQLAEKEQERKEQSRLSSRTHDAKKRAERAAAARIAMSSPPAEPSPGVQSPPFSLPHHNRRPRTPLSSLNPMQLLSNESMERLLAADHVDSVVINNSVNTLKDVLKEAIDLVHYKAEMRERREEAHLNRTLNDELT